MGRKRGTCLLLVQVQISGLRSQIYRGEKFTSGFKLAVPVTQLAQFHTRISRGRKDGGLLDDPIEEVREAKLPNTSVKCSSSDACQSDATTTYGKQ